MRRRLQRHQGSGRLRIFALVTLAGLSACARLQVLEDSPTSVSLRFGGTTTQDDAFAEATRLCAAHGKVAQLRSSDTKGVLERYANFNCVSH